MPNDILIDESFDIGLKNGDFEVGESTYQHQQILILADKGQFKASPLTGVGARRYLETSKPDDLAREIRQEFMKDGMTVRTIEILKDLQINVDAIYE